MAPRGGTHAKAQVAALPRGQPKKSKAVISTSSMFKKPVQSLRSTTMAQNRNIAPSKSSLVGKPQGVVKKQAPGNYGASILKRVKHVEKNPDHPLSLAFNDSSENYRSTVLDDAQTALSDTRHALFARIDTTNASAPDAATASNEDDRRVPTTADLKTTHNALVADLTSPLRAELLAYGDPRTKERKEHRKLGDIMADYKKVVAREERTLGGLQRGWNRVHEEIRLLSVDIFGDADTAAMMGLAAAGSVAEQGRPLTGIRLGVEKVEALKLAVTHVADETLAEVDEAEENERRMNRQQKKKMADSIIKMGDL